ncbi:hypothetical protein ES332_A01G126100v1 [Gossypium tomentosum]|nr:hypothetical protein ES332_A01G126100v1 [Gossypium tomentosum]
METIANKTFMLEKRRKKETFRVRFCVGISRKREKVPDTSLEGYSSSDGFNEGDEVHFVVT